MIFKLKDLVSFNLNSQKIFQEKLPLTCAYKLSKIQRAIAEDLEFYQKKYLEIVNEYGDKDENGNLKYSENGTVVLMIPERKEEAQKEINELDNMEVDLDLDNYLLELSDFEKDKKISMQELVGILPFMR